jgi:hypothetical protein
MKELDILSAILYLLPGFIYTEIWRNFVPSKYDRDFARILYSMLWSIFFLFLAYLFDNIFDLLNIFSCKESDKVSIGSNFINIKLFAFLYLTSLLTVFTRIGFRKLRYLALKIDKFKFLAPKPYVLWYKIQRDKNWALVITKDAQRYLGYISDYTFDPNCPDETDLLLSDADCVNEDMTSKYKITGQGLYIKLSEISRIEFYK